MMLRVHRMYLWGRGSGERDKSMEYGVKGA